jgi:glycosyltransferase involved in cell wall biosynthesis
LPKVTERKEKEYELADLVVANSIYVRDTFLEAGFPESRIVAIPTGCPAPVARGIVRKRKDDRFRFLCVGTVSLRKGIPFLLEAWKGLQGARHAELILAGPMDLANSEMLGRLDGVRWLGKLGKSDLDAEYAQADVFLAASLCEGLAHSLLEALSFGLPIITTRESGAGDFVEPGKNGLIVEAANSKSLRLAMESMMDRRADLQEMGRNSLDKARAWSVQDSNRAHLKALEAFLAKQD